ncbi:MAG: fibronectin type III domain-containing protein, partial [Porticoccus sp.]
TALLSWSDVDDETGYEIQREQAHKKRANTWNSTTLVGTNAADDTTFTDASGAKTFRYRVRAFNNSGTSDWSGWAEVTVTDSGGGGGGGDKPCRGKKCNP